MSSHVERQLKKVLPERRYRHSLAVAHWAKALAQRHRGHGQHAFLAGLLHDCARHLSPDKLRGLLEGYRGKYFDSATKATPALWHNPAGVVVARRDYNIRHPYILRAMALHSTGDRHMRLLDKIIYVADFSEPGRIFAQAQEVALVAREDLDQAVWLTVKYKVAYLLGEGKTVHPRSLALARGLSIVVSS